MFTHSIALSLKGISKDKETSIHSFDPDQFQTDLLAEDNGSWEMRFYSSKFDENDSDDEYEDLSLFFDQADEAQSSVAQWLTAQDEGLFKKLNQPYEIQLLIQETADEAQFVHTFPPDLILATGMKGIPLIYQYECDLEEEADRLAMSGDVAVCLRASREDAKLLHEDFLGQLQLQDPIIDEVRKSKEEGIPALIGFHHLGPEFSDQIFFENFSKIASWLDQQKNQLFLDLQENGVHIEIFIGGLLDGDRFRFAFPPDFLLACGRKNLVINLYIND